MQAQTGPAPSNTVPAGFVRAALRHALEQGHDCGRILRDQGIDTALLDDEQARIPVARYAALQVAVMRTMNDESLGYAALPSRVGTWQMACLSSVHRGSIGHAVGRMCKFYRVLERGLRPQLVIEGDDALLEVVLPQGEPQWDLYAYEMTFLIMRRFMSWLLKEPLPLRAVTLPHEPPAHLAEYRWMFPGAEVSFRRPRAALRFDRRVLDLSVQRDQRELEELLLNPIVAILDASGTPRTWGERIRELMVRELPWLPEFEDVATRLSIHPQTLRRRLAHEGLTFNDIKNQVRCEAAEYYLNKQIFSVEEVAFRSGFSEASSFIRAFRRWTGMTPCAYAQSQRSRMQPTTPATAASDVAIAATMAI